MQQLFRNIDSPETTWSVSELTAYIKEIFDIDYRLQDVSVAGEISNFSRARSGHLYFTLKDNEAQLKCVMWRSAVQKLSFLTSDGDAVVATGRVSVYEASGVYQLYVESLQPAGRGDLALKFEQLKQKLAAEGLFDEIHKKNLPEFPTKIGIVTSADAAALRDVLNVLGRRWPLTSVLIAPTLVQGKEAPAQIIRALEYLDGRNDIDLVIVTRGGGSIEDLWAFNDEEVARAIFAADHPVVVGVGHETDYTISDFVADVRAPTPSAAAEIAVPDINEKTEAIWSNFGHLKNQMENRLRMMDLNLASAVRTLRHLSPVNQIVQSRLSIDMMTNRIDQAMIRYLEKLNSRFTEVRSRLITVDPKATLTRGYAIVMDKNHQIVQSQKKVHIGDPLRIRFHDGEIEAKVSGKQQDGKK